MGNGNAAARQIPLHHFNVRQLLEPDACTRCGECLNWCPVYAVDKKEGITPRSKLDTLKRLLKSQHGLFARLAKKQVDASLADEFVKAVYECTVCGQCHYVCPVRIDTPELWEAVREALVAAGYSQPGDQAPYLEKIKQFNNPFLEPAERRRAWADEAAAAGRIKPVKNILEDPAPVLYFVGCTASYDPKVKTVAEYTAAVLQKAGVDFGILGEHENCCRGKLRRMGDPAFAALGKENVDAFNTLGVRTVVTSCAGCYKTLKQDYPKLGRENFEVLHITEYLDRLLDEGRLSFERSLPLTVTYHDPCHLGRHNHIYDAPRRVLQAIPGLTLTEMERIRQNSRCCGGGGGMKLAFHDVQVAVTTARLHEAEETGATDLVTPCPTCALTLLSGTDAAGTSIRVRHELELVYLACGGENPSA